MEDTRIHWNRFNQYYDVLAFAHSSLSYEVVKFFNYREIVALLIDGYMGPQSPLWNDNRAPAREAIARHDRPSDLKEMIYLLALGVCACHNDKSEATGIVPPNSLNKGPLLRLSHRDAQFLLDSKFFRHVLHPAGVPVSHKPHNILANRMMCAHLAFEDKDRTLWLCQTILNRVTDTGTGTQFDGVVQVIEEMLNIKDSLVEWRMKVLLNYKPEGVLNVLPNLHSHKVQQIAELLWTLVHTHPMLPSWIVSDKGLQQSLLFGLRNHQYLAQQFQSLWSTGDPPVRVAPPDETFENELQGLRKSDDDDY